MADLTNVLHNYKAKKKKKKMYSSLSVLFVLVVLGCFSDRMCSYEQKLLWGDYPTNPINVI